ncbi:MAG: glycosyltransferase family 4 protein [Cyanobacteria bacterium P01_G01_bin.39]
MKIAVIGAKDLTVKPEEIDHYCQKLYLEIAAKGHQVDFFIAPSYHQPSLSISYYHQIRIITLLSIPGTQSNFLLNSALNTICATFGKYDVIHVHSMAAAWFLWFPRLFSDSSIVVTSHQLEHRQSDWNRFWRRLLPRMEKTAARNADEVIVTSRELSNYFRRKYGINPQYIANAPASYDLPDLSYDCNQAHGIDNRKYLLYWGKVEPDNKLDLLIRAFQQLPPHNWLLVVIGGIDSNPEYASNTLSIVKEQDNIIFLGDARGNALAEIISGANIFVEPSARTDFSLPMTLLEMMRQGIPILGSDTIARRQLLQDRGLLFKSGQLDSLVTQLEYAMSEPALLAVMARNAQRYIAVNHNWDKVVYQNLFLYIQLTSNLSPQAEKNRAFNREGRADIGAEFHMYPPLSNLDGHTSWGDSKTRLSHNQGIDN